MPQNKKRRRSQPLQKTMDAIENAIRRGGVDRLSIAEQRRVNLFVLRQEVKKRKRERGGGIGENHKTKVQGDGIV